MQILLIRHSQAEKREDWNDLGNPDNLRPLTKKGISRFADAVSGLENFIPKIDHIYSSQYTRALQTAEMLHGHYKDANFSIISELNPGGDFQKIRKVLQDFSDTSTIALVGHQPDLSELTSFLMNEKKEHLIRYKKGGAALINCQGGQAELHWLLTQQQLINLSTL